MTSILQNWVMNLGLRHQGVLVSSIRGCDNAPRHDPSKIIQRLLRGSILIPHVLENMIIRKPICFLFMQPK